MGKKGNDLSKSARLELILLILETYGKGDGVTTGEIFLLCNQSFPGMSKRTLFRDLNELSTRVPVSDQIVDGKRRWILSLDSQAKERLTHLKAKYQEEILGLLRKVAGEPV